jgi:hypothetical protein
MNTMIKVLRVAEMLHKTILAGASSALIVAGLVEHVRKVMNRKNR